MRLTSLAKFFAVVAISLAMLSCSDTGVQGTSLYSSFSGINEVVALSPTAVKLSWNLDSRYSEYRIYQGESVTSIKTETFSSTTVDSLIPGTTYQFYVTGYSGSNGESDKSGGKGVTTFNNFQGLRNGGVTLRSSSEVALTWSLNSPTAAYKVYSKIQGESWNFAQPRATLSAANTYTVEGLQGGRVYCFYVVANYLDSTSEPELTQSAANAANNCILVTSNLSSLPAVTVSPASIGDFPYFRTSSGDPTYKTEIYELDTDVRVASTVGNNPFRAFWKTNQGVKNYYALVSKDSQVARVAVKVAGSSSSAGSVIRNFNQSEPKNAIFPSVLNGGKGLQSLGSKVKNGDFNCDGLTDFAISLPDATPFSTENHALQMGGVVVYYGYKPPPYVDPETLEIIEPDPTIKMDVEPSMTGVYPNPVLIAYSSTVNNMGFGADLATANINGDCYLRGGLDPGNPADTDRSGSCDQLFKTETTRIKQIKSCEDLVIGTRINEFYIIFGDADQGLVAGSGANASGEDEFTCDPITGDCRVVRHTSPAGYSNFGQAMTVGDFNNDGYDDLAVTAQTASRKDILIYRGDAQGLHSKFSTRQHAPIDTSTTGTAGFVGLNLALTDEAGYSLGTAYGSRSCINGTPTAGHIFRTNFPGQKTGIDATKCDDLVIGAPGRDAGRGSIFTCKAELNTVSVTDKQQIASWQCAEHYPQELLDVRLTNPGVNIRYGHSVLGVKNQNGYPLYNIIGSILPRVPNETGAVFVGAPRMPVSGAGDAGRVYGYYITPTSTDYQMGGIQWILGNGAHPIEAVNSVPCDRLNQNKITMMGGTPVNHCQNQAISLSPPSAGAQFGEALGSVVDRVSTDGESTLPYLAIAAPRKSIQSPTGQTLSQAGVVYLYRGDVSTFGIEDGWAPDPAKTISAPVLNVDKIIPGFCNKQCTWYSGGVSPYGPSVIYPSTLTENARFGLSGVAGGDFNGDHRGDILVGAPGHRLPVVGNGATFIYNSQEGFGPSETAPDVTFNGNYSLEGSYRFEEIKVAGDLNGDGYADAVTHQNSNGVWQIVVFYGSANGLVKSPTPSASAIGTQPLLITSMVDSLIGYVVTPVGDVNGDGFNDIMSIGSQANYLFYGSSSGIIAGEPTLAPVGKNPLKFALSSGANLYQVSFTSIPGWNGYLPSTYRVASGNHLSYGDFNKDGYSDIVISTSRNWTPAISVIPAGWDFGMTNTGRVMIIYGGPSGPQTNRLTGRILYKQNDGSAADVVVENPCTNVVPPVCKMQMISAPGTSGRDFGFAVASQVGKGGSYSPMQDGLLISDPRANAITDGAVYVYRGTLQGLSYAPIQTLVPRNPGTRFGTSLAELGDVNKDQYSDIAIGSWSSLNAAVTVFYGANLGGQLGFYGDDDNDITGTDYWTAPAIVTNNRFLDASAPRPQVIRPPGTPVTIEFSRGISAAGDFNHDGYMDMAVNVPNGDFTGNGTIIGTGYILIYFGSELGLQSQSVAISPYPRCYSGDGAICEPYQLFLPSAIAYEYTFMSQFSLGDINGDGIKDLVVGGVGRNHPSGNAPAAGVIYVHY